MKNSKYICMLKSLFETTKDGRRCVLCGALNHPDSHHLVQKSTPCVVAGSRPIFKRRYDMVGHLKDAHNISNGGIVAEKWRCQSSKKAWLCGFRVRLLPCLQERLGPVGTEHFEKGEGIKDWGTSKVIQGLLFQPRIREAWLHLLESHGHFRPSETKWGKLGTEFCDIDSKKV